MKAKASSALKWLLEIKHGDITVKVYRGKNHVNGTTYDQFTLVYYDGA